MLPISETPLKAAFRRVHQVHAEALLSLRFLCVTRKICKSYVEFPLIVWQLAALSRIVRVGRSAG